MKTVHYHAPETPSFTACGLGVLDVAKDSILSVTATLSNDAAEVTCERCQKWIADLTRVQLTMSDVLKGMR